jgi:molecular chaperone DnaK (HSP70)
MTEIIPRGSEIPISKSRNYTTLSDNQTLINLDIFEGERTLAEDNHLIAEFHLESIPPAPKGSPIIQVTMEMDRSGILTVTAENIKTG